MLIECGSCPVTQRACAACSIGALLSMPPVRSDHRSEARLDAAERRAVQAFVAAGLVLAEEAADLVALVGIDAIAV